MDRAGSFEWTMRDEMRCEPAEEWVLPTRAKALSILIAGLKAENGPVLLTGEPGVGKSWLCRRLRNAVPGSWRWIEIDLSPAVSPSDLYRLILHRLGLCHHGGIGEARGLLAGAISEATADGARSGLIVEEAHCGSLEVLEELRVLASRMGQPEAFAGMVLVGQTSLALRLSGRPLASLQARLADRVHLRPLGVDELHALIRVLDTGHGTDLERLHRAVAGNPRQLILLIGPKQGAVATQANSGSPPPAPPPAPKAPMAPTVAAWEPPSLVAVKPPLHVDEGMIEVGWDESSNAPAEIDNSEDGLGASAQQEPPSEALVDDHYAALQAWTEWAAHEKQRAQHATESGQPHVPASSLLEDDEPSDAAASRPSEGRPSVWAEGQHAFAPYSQLFSRLRLSRDAQ